MSKIGFIGVGAMGEPMVANLLKKGFQVTVLKHRRADAVTRLEAQGATITSSRETLASNPIVVLCLPTSREVEEAVLGEEGLSRKMAAKTVIVDCSTSHPDSTLKLTRLLEEKKIGLVAAPMTRGVLGAKQGTLAFFLGGEKDDIQKARPALEAMGNTFIEFALASQAHAAKVISNVLSYSTVAVVNEALMLGAKTGLDLGILHKALMEGAPSKSLEAFGPRIISGEYAPARVTIDHVCEDMVLAQELAAATSSPVFMHSTAQELYRMLQARGDGERDISAIAEIWRLAAPAQTGVRQ